MPSALPMPHLEESLGELRRALDQLGMAGIAMNTTVLGRALVEPAYGPVSAELNRRRAVLYLHPAGNSACTPLIRDYHLTWMAGAPAEDTISVMQLITHGIPARYPDIKIINSHLGGALPMLLQRADDPQIDTNAAQAILDRTPARCSASDKRTGNQSTRHRAIRAPSGDMSAAQGLWVPVPRWSWTMATASRCASPEPAEKA